MNEQNETTQLRFLEETATRLRQNGFTVEPIEDHHLPVCWEKGRLCRISGKGSVLYRQENMDSIRAQDALQRILRPDTIYILLTVQHAALAGNAAEAPFFPADGQVVILDGLYRETVLPQPGGGFFKETELRGFILIVHCEVLLVSKKISRSILKCSGRVMD